MNVLRKQKTQTGINASTMLVVWSGFFVFLFAGTRLILIGSPINLIAQSFNYFRMERNYWFSQEQKKTLYHFGTTTTVTTNKY